MIESKENIRKRLLSKLLSFAQEEIERRSKNVERIISNLSVYKGAKSIMVYYPLKGEVNLLGIVRKALNNKEVCFPVIDLKNKNLIPCMVGDLERDFVKGPYGVREPDIKKTEQYPVGDLDLVFVPGVAFSPSKYRLGRGGGFYDRFIKTLSRRTKTIGVAFDCQIIDDLPVSIPYDERVDFIVTESAIF